MFDIGWQEFILVALVAVVVVGPKDLPRVIRTVGQWIRKARSLASEFQGSLEEMAREAELDDVRKSIQDVSRGGIGATIEKHVDPDGEIRRSVEEARDSSGTDEIEGAIDEARRDTQALASSGGSTGTYEPPAAQNPIPDNSVTPPADAPAPKPAAAKATARKSAAKADAGAKPAKAPAKRASAKASTAKPGTAKTGTAKTSSAAAKPAAKPKRTTRKPAATDAGEA